MYKLVKWSDELDLTKFYKKAEERGFHNNSSKEVMIDCFNNERDYMVWILYMNDEVIGSVAAHSLDILGSNAYRICARTCSFAEARPYKGLLSATKIIREHQNFTAQFFIPAAVEWLGLDKDLYISSHPSDVGTQRIVHNIYCPTLVKTGALEYTCDLEYRGHYQTFWKLNKPVFLNQLSKYHRWVTDQ